MGLSAIPQQTHFHLSLFQQSSRRANCLVKGLALHYAQAMSFSSLRRWVNRSTTSTTSSAEITPNLSPRAGAEAQFLRGLNFASGQGVAQDYVQAAQCYTEATEHGCAQSQ